MPKAAHPTQLKNGKWRIRWLDEHGVRQSDVLESFREAEHQLAARQVEAEERRRGIRAAAVQPKKFDVICDYWLAKRAVRKRSQADDESIIRRHLRPAFGKLALAEVNVQAVDDFVVERDHLNVKTVANHLTLLISLLRLAHELGWLLAVPRIKKPRIQLFSRDFRYLRTKEEVRRFLAAARTTSRATTGHRGRPNRYEDELAHILYTTAVLTGLRAGELAALQWGDVDLEARRLTVQRSFDGPTKSGDIRHVPLMADELPRMLREWRLRCSGQLVFPNRDGRMHQPCARVFQEELHRTLERGGFARGYVTFHCLRHTFASHYMLDGGDIFKLQRYLGHKSQTMTQRYAHLAPEAFAADYGRMSGMASTAPTKVHALTG
jgi:integrase